MGGVLFCFHIIFLAVFELLFSFCFPAVAWGFPVMAVVFFRC
ncbi:hypothetical protein BACCELL_04208 [Bacteroides cellulosilyticus DSM 14838]|uniref:Uncharacterized protein n=1 Tax=Bacteroides cellulosilyticus DSM 14838 TaxID=537012 RepID=E2NIS2_9BACE|nr:hypothetical protein BACCELL_04208 [Bacteroides cellulosilyticus DSM 14838]